MDTTDRAFDADAPRTAPMVLASTAPLLLSPLDWVFDVVADAGYAGTELLLAHTAESRDPDRIARLKERTGLEVPVVHGPYMLFLRRVLGSSYLTKSRRSFELAAAMGAGTMVAHAPFRWERNACGWIGSEADDEAEEHGTRLGMENLYPVAGRAFSSVITPDQLAPFRHVVFDTSHFAVAGIDLFDAWDAIGHRVVHLHVSDNHGNGRDSHAPIGHGTLPLADFLGRVGASGFTGTITLELDCRPYLDTRESLVAFLAEERIKAERLLRGDPLPLREPVPAPQLRRLT